MVVLLSLALQLQLAAPAMAASPRTAQVAPDRDSLRDLGRAHDAQAGFERGRRYVLPWGTDSGGRCKARCFERAKIGRDERRREACHA